MLSVVVILGSVITFLPLIMFPMELYGQLTARERGVPNYLLSFLVTVLPILFFLNVPALKAKAPDLAAPSTTDAIVIFVWYGLILATFVWDVKRVSRLKEQRLNEQKKSGRSQHPEKANAGTDEEQKKIEIDKLIYKGLYASAFQIASEENRLLMNHLAKELLKVIHTKNTKSKMTRYAKKVLRKIRETGMIVDRKLLAEIVEVVEQ
jgi:hypothetical protein